jgi:hypothetical protein
MTTFRQRFDFAQRDSQPQKAKSKKQSYIASGLNIILSTTFKIASIQVFLRSIGGFGNRLFRIFIALIYIDFV